MSYSLTTGFRCRLDAIADRLVRIVLDHDGIRGALAAVIARRDAELTLERLGQRRLALMSGTAGDGEEVVVGSGCRVLGASPPSFAFVGILEGVTSLAAALVDVGGTLWPDGWPAMSDDRLSSAGRLCAALPELSPDQAIDLVSALETAAGTLDGAIEQDVDRYVGETLRRRNLPAGPQETAAVFSAMCVAAHGRVELFPYAEELLQTLRRRDLRCAVVSNTLWRDNAAYWRDFTALGVAPLIDAVVSSVDLGYRKPHRAMFEAGAAAVGVALADCVVIGNSEICDVQPAKALGLLVVRVALEEPPPAVTGADHVVGSLREAASVISQWCVHGLTG